ncbi:MAG: hypothetical protein JXR37_31570 [Kiritimatiellae bacterium]|nr:hypothetical protein [Kiritimatiellia bacterium]
MTDTPFERIAVLDNEFQAQVLEGMLAEREIPHRIRSYHDSVLDGLFQGAKGWGHVEAPAEYAEEIRALLEALIRESPDAQPEDDPQS